MDIKEGNYATVKDYRPYLRKIGYDPDTLQKMSQSFSSYSATGNSSLSA